MNRLPEIPQSWLIGGMMVGLIVLRTYGIDSWTTAALSLIIGYLTGKHIEATKPIVAIPLEQLNKEEIWKK